MKVSELVLNGLAKLVCGDSGVSPYMTGPTLVELFNKYGFHDSYASGFGSRWKYTEDKLRSINGSKTFQEVLEDILDPRRYVGTDKYNTEAISRANELLKFDGYAVIAKGESVKLIGIAEVAVESHSTKAINHAFISEQINKSQKKVDEGDYNGAITNARSLVEAVFIEVIERFEKDEVKNDGSIDNLWKRVKTHMKLDIDKEAYPDFVIQILSGVDTAVKGLAGLSNNAGDRHANKFKTRKHHARLAVNLSIAISDFLFESLEYQQEQALKF